MTQTNRSVMRLLAVVLIGVLFLASLSGCGGRNRGSQTEQPRRGKYETVRMEATGYSNDPVSTGWRRGWLLFWRAYLTGGSNRGRRKIVGLTSSGEWARYGTIAADTRHYPYGTVMIVPGYGKGVVQDIGGAIKGPNRIDLFFKTRKRAIKWGRQTVNVRVKRPR